MMPFSRTTVTNSADRTEALHEWRRLNQPYLEEGLSRLRLAQEHDIPTFFGALHLKGMYEGQHLDFGLVSLRVVTLVAVERMVECLMGTLADLSAFTYHGVGTGINPPGANDTALQTELTTEYATDNTRPSSSAPTSPVNYVWSTQVSIEVDSPVSVFEHGVFNSATVGSGDLLDRSRFQQVDADFDVPIDARFDLVFIPGG